MHRQEPAPVKAGGKADKPYEFGVKVSVATTIGHAKGGQFVTHVKALPGSPYDGHTLATVIPDMEALIGNIIARLLADRGYRGHNAPPDYKFRVFISGQKRGVTPTIKRELRRRAAVEPVIGHLKAEHRMGRNYLWFRRGDAANAVLAAAGYNFRRLIRWLRFLLRQILGSNCRASGRSNLRTKFFTDDELPFSLVGGINLDVVPVPSVQAGGVWLRSLRVEVLVRIVVVVAELDANVSVRNFALDRP